MCACVCVCCFRVKTSELFERWRNLQVCKWTQNKEETDNFKWVHEDSSLLSPNFSTVLMGFLCWNKGMMSSPIGFLCGNEAMMSSLPLSNRMSLSRCCNAPSFLFTTKRNTPSGTKLRYEVDTSGILHISPEIFKMFPDVSVKLCRWFLLDPHHSELIWMECSK